MEYTVSELAKLAGITSRTLRYYDEIGLLSSKRMSSNGYRIYGQKEVDRLQQILFYRELGIPLDEVGRILSDKDFDDLFALQDHLDALLEKRKQLDLLIANVKNTIKAKKGEIIMNDKEKFEGFLRKMVEDNEQKYGNEIREKYGEDMINNSNAKILSMNLEQYAELEKLTEELNQTLKEAVEQRDPASPLAQRACELHKQWLLFFWNKYSKEAHISLTQMYVDDPGFNEYYEKISPGCAAFLRDAVALFCQQ